MKKITAKFLRVFTNKSGNLMAIYAITQISAEQLAEYKEMKGEFYQEEDGYPLFFTEHGGADTINITFRNGKAYVDNSDIQRKQMIAKQFGGDLGKAIADQLAQSLVGDILGTRTAPAPQPEPEPENDTENLGKL